jgi:hypothetical protein
MTTHDSAVRYVTGSLREHVENCRVLAEAKVGSEHGHWGEVARLWALLADGAASGLFTLLDMGVDIGELIEREVTLRALAADIVAETPIRAAGSARLLAAMAEADYDLGPEPVTAFELLADAPLAADVDTAGADQ